MKNFRLFIFMLIVAVSFGFAPKQLIKLFYGDLKPLKDQSLIGLEFRYDSMMVSKDKEQDYVARKKKEWDGKEPGKGDQFQAMWFENRKKMFEPTFLFYFTKNAGLKYDSVNAPYTVIFKTKFTEPGWNIGIKSQPGGIDAEAWIVDSKDKSKVIAKISLQRFYGKVGRGGDFDSGERIQEGYVAAAKTLGDFLKQGRLK